MAFDAAVVAGADAIELDLQLSKDGMVVAYHDKTFRQIDRSRRKVAQLTWAELRELDFGAWFDDRFQGAIDRAAMRAGLRDTDAYLGEWRRVVTGECGEDLEAEADGAAARVDADYPQARLRALVANGGRQPAPEGAPE